MKKTLLTGGLILALAAGLYFTLKSFNTPWSGVDETVVEKFAREAGRPPRTPLINTDQGDLLLFFFLIAGSAGGFVGGYYFRELFPPKPNQPNV
ncbi:MAG: cobalt transporter [Verrucomicrobia bacterium]|nr:cobalt transporter [Verrucomicrobiota bacterium]